ncbi:MAG: HAD family hydrolase [Coriobacteriia bacterium]|nr:HAD family hydrolase [Coriobacteriia bacterium]
MTSLDAKTKTGGALGASGLIQFDLDGTILDTYEQILLSMRYTINGVYGKNFTDDELMYMVGVPIKQQFEYFVPEDPENALKVYVDFERNKLNVDVKPFEGIEEALQELRTLNYKMVVVTSKRHVAAVNDLSKNNLLAYFEEVIGADDVLRGKPDPYPVIYAADTHGFPLQNVIYIGDSPYDMQAAKSAGVFKIAVDWGMFSEETLMSFNPESYIHSPHEIVPAVKSLIIPR